MAAVRGGFMYIVSVLLLCGVDPNVCNQHLVEDIDNDENNYNSVLIEAVRQKSFTLTELLLRLEMFVVIQGDVFFNVEFFK